MNNKAWMSFGILLILGGVIGCRSRGIDRLTGGGDELSFMNIAEADPTPTETPTPVPTIAPPDPQPSPVFKRKLKITVDATTPIFPKPNSWAGYFCAELINPPVGSEGDLGCVQIQQPNTTGVIDTDLKTDKKVLVRVSIPSKNSGGPFVASWKMKPPLPPLKKSFRGRGQAWVAAGKAVVKVFREFI